MKKAYVKPVFLAEEFVAETSYANTTCGTGTQVALEIKDGDCFCSKDKNCASTFYENGDQGTVHTLYKDVDDDAILPNNVNPDNFTIWNYATYNNDKAYLFGSSLQECDFVWSGNKEDQVYVWGSTDKSIRTNPANLLTKALGIVSQFFAGNGSSHGKHPVGYNQTVFQSL